ncbi:MAG: hypothetical protein KIH08_16755 [Candidatus Freyarchaeota archaeon]|nr:hypothetical protein [Candidatus Jordarchaeia archaeon]MBS7267377.1 hypothetical protein [Candidatus Jordarchaeia archaeon]MBS7281498.1 hypothetical protein [Candidatus Jordarchaeia archaeon]
MEESVKHFFKALKSKKISEFERRYLMEKLIPNVENDYYSRLEGANIIED